MKGRVSQVLTNPISNIWDPISTDEMRFAYVRELCQSFFLINKSSDENKNICLTSETIPRNLHSSSLGKLEKK